MQMITMILKQYKSKWTGVEINIGLLAHGQWLVGEICFPMARLACKILKPNF